MYRLPKLVQYTIGYHLEYKDLVSFSLTCKKFWQMFSDDYFWKAKLSLITPVTLQNTLAEYKSFKDLGRAVYNQVIRFKDKKPYELFEGDVDSDEYYLPILDCKNVTMGRNGFCYIDQEGRVYKWEGYVYNIQVSEKVSKVVLADLFVGVLTTEHNLYIRNTFTEDALHKIGTKISRFAVSEKHIAIVTCDHHLLVSSRQYPKHFERSASNVIDIAAGRQHLLYLDCSGNVYGLGDSRCNQLNSDVDYINYWIPILSDVTKIYAGHDSSGFITRNGNLYACGYITSLLGSNSTLHLIDNQVADVAIGSDLMAILKLDHDLYFLDKSGKNYVMSNVWQVNVYYSNIIARGFVQEELKPLLVTLNNMARVSMEDGEELEEGLDYSDYRALFEKYRLNIYSLLFTLIENNHYNKETLSLAIEFGLDINLQHPIFPSKSLRGSCTPLTSSAEFLDIHIVQSLLEHGVDIKLRDGESYNVYESILRGKFSPENIKDVETLLNLLATYDNNPCIRETIYTDLILRSEYTVYWNSHIIRKFLENVEIDKIIG